MITTVGNPRATREPHGPTIRSDPPATDPASSPVAEPAGWRVWLPIEVEAGIHAQQEHPAATLREVGEQWVGPGGLVPEHSHDAWEIYLQLQGRSTWQVAGATVHLAAGWVLAVPPGVRHRESARGEGRHQFAYAVVDVAAVGRRHPALATAWRTHRPRWSAGGRPLAPLFRMLVHEVVTGTCYSEVVVEATVDLLLTQTTRLLAGPTVTQPRIPRHPAVARARHLLDHEYAVPWTVEELAVACAVSRSRLAELFTAEVGLSPYAYLLQRRVERACELLGSTTYSVSEVAALVGFRSHVQLARHVRRVTGRSPSGWRDRPAAPAGSSTPAHRSSADRQSP